MWERAIKSDRRLAGKRDLHNNVQGALGSVQKLISVHSYFTIPDLSPRLRKYYSLSLFPLIISCFSISHPRKNESAIVREARLREIGVRDVYRLSALSDYASS